MRPLMNSADRELSIRCCSEHADELNFEHKTKLSAARNAQRFGMKSLVFAALISPVFLVPGAFAQTPDSGAAAGASPAQSLPVEPLTMRAPTKPAVVLPSKPLSVQVG